MRTLMAVMMLIPALARAQSPEHVIAAPEPQENQVQDTRPYWSTCQKVWTRAPYATFRLDAPLYLPGSLRLPSTGGTPSGGGSSSGGGVSGGGLGSIASGGKPEALLVLAVVALAVIPFVVYFADSEADDLTMDRFYCPEFNFTAMGGVQMPTRTGARAIGLGIAKLRMDVGYVGAMAEVGLSPAVAGVAGSFSAHFLLRPPPKKHIEGALALGGRRAVGPGSVLDGFEVALPHMYVFSRDGYKKLGLEAMPRVFVHRGGYDVGADLTMVIPVADVMQLRVGGAVFSHAGALQLSASAGLSATL